MQRGGWSAGSLLASVVLLLSSCGNSELACTLIGSVPGVSVTVDSAVARDVTRLDLRVCWDAGATRTCHPFTARLDPGSDSVDQGCDGASPDSVCSATVVPNGSKVGFVEVADLPAGAISVTATATVAGKRRTYPTVDVPAGPTYPNGPDCGTGGNQAKITLGSTGLR